MGGHGTHGYRLLALPLRIAQVHVVEALVLGELRALEPSAHVDRCNFCFQRYKASSANLLTTGLLLNLPAHL
jgi:hypothetical protein